MESIIEINVRNITVVKENDRYDVTLKWEVTNESDSDYKGPFTVSIYSGTEVIESQSIPVGFTGIFDGISLDENQSYYAVVSVKNEETGDIISSNNTRLLLKEFRDVQAICDGERVVVKWNNDEAIDNGTLVLTDGNSQVIYEIKTYDKSIKIEDFYKLDNTRLMQLYLVPRNGEVCQGPYTKYDFNFIKGSIVELCDFVQNDKTVDLDIIIDVNKDYSEDMLIELLVYKADKKICTSKSISVVVCDGNSKSKVKAKFSIGGSIFDAELIQLYDIEIGIVKGIVESSFSEIKERIPLAPATINSIRVSNNCADIDFNYNAARIPDYYKVTVGENSYSTFEKHISIIDKNDINMKTAIVRPVFGEALGLASLEESLFDAGYYIEESGDTEPALVLSINKYDEEKVYVEFGQNIFNIPISEAISDENHNFTLSFDKDNSVYSLCVVNNKSVEGTVLKNNYDTFIKNLLSQNITPGGLYLIVDALARIVRIPCADLLYYYYGFSKEGLYVDLRPGLILKVEYENYKLNNDTSSFIAGNIVSSTSEYSILLCMEEGNPYLKFDSFLASFGSRLNVADSNTKDSNGLQNGGGGIVDLFSKAMKQPYYRLQYPAEFMGSDSRGDTMPSMNAILIASSSYNSINTASTNLINSPTGNNVTDANYFYFRGRAVVTVNITVWINGEIVTVPVGTTIGDIAQRFIGGVESISVKRSMNGLGKIYNEEKKLLNDKLTPIKIDCCKNSRHLTLPLMNGDRITI